MVKLVSMMNYIKIILNQSQFINFKSYIYVYIYQSLEGDHKFLVI